MKVFPHITLKVWIIALFAFLSILFTHPAIFHLTDSLIGDGGDNYEFYSYQLLVKDNLLHGRPPFSDTAMLRYPLGFNLGLGSDARLFVLVGGVLQLICNEVVVYNVLILIIFFLNGYCSYLFFKKISKSTAIGIFGGIAYGYSYFVLTRGAGHINLLQIFGFPLLFSQLIDFFEKGASWTVKQYYIASCTVLLITVSSLQYLLMLTAIVLILTVSLFVMDLFHPVGIRKFFSFVQVKALGVSATLFFCANVIFFYQFIPIIFGQRFTQTSLPTAESLQVLPSSVILKGVVFPNIYQSTTVLSKALGPVVRQQHIVISDFFEISYFFGYVEIALFLYFIFFGKKNKRTTLVLFCLWISFFLFVGVGDIAHMYPYYYLLHVVPFSWISEPWRFVVFMYFFFLILAAQAVQMISSSKYGKIIVTAIIFLIVGERISGHYYLSSALKRPYQKIVAQTAASAVLDIPLFFGNGMPNQSHYNLLPFYYGKPIVNGYINWPAETSVTRSFINSNNELTRFFCDFSTRDPFVFIPIPIVDLASEQTLNRTMIARLKNAGITTIVVHKNYLAQHECYSVRRRLVHLLGDLSFDEASISSHDYREALDMRSYSANMIRSYSDTDVIVYTLP